MGMNDVPRCQHVKMNGTQCGSPALRRKRHCYFHHRMRDGRKRYGQGDVSPRPMYTMCLLEDANSVQVALMQVLELLACGQMEPRVAGLMLYGLQTASSNLRLTKFEAKNATDVVIDRNDVHRTCIDGQQWFEEDFGVEEDEPPQALAEHENGEEELVEKENETEIADSQDSAEGITEGDWADGDSVEEDSAQEDSAQEDSAQEERREPVRACLRKAAPVENPVTIEEARKRVQGLIRNFLLDRMPQKSAASPG